LDEELRGRPVGVDDLVEVAFFPPDEEGLPFPAEELLLLDISGCPVEWSPSSELRLRRLRFWFGVGDV